MISNHRPDRRRAALNLCGVLWAAAFVFLGAAPAAQAQGRSGGPVAFTAAVSPQTARPGDKVTVTVTATVREPYHIYSVVAVAPPAPAETKVTVEAPGLTPTGGNTESAPKQVDDPNFGKTIGMHSGTATFTQAMEVAKGAKPGKVPLTVKVRYMACDDTSCLPPKTVTVSPAPELTVVAGDGGAAAPVAAPATGAPAGKVTKAGPVAWSGALSRSAARAGEAVAVTVTAQVDEPFHIYSVVPVPDGPQATTLSVEGSGVAPAGEVVESKAEQIDDPNFGKTIGMHAGRATFTRVVEVARTVAPGKSLPLTVKVRYMACNETSCLPPKTVTVEVPALQVEAGAARPEFSRDAVTKSASTIAALMPSGGAGDAGTPPSAPSTADTPAAQQKPPALGAFLLGAFGAGLLALVTPCVFPMIPVTLAFFTKQAAAKGQEGAAAQAAVVRLAAVYSLGIVVAFTGIGAVMAATVGAAGANRLAANPWVNLTFATLFVVFAFALLEVIEIRPPAALQGLSMKGRSTGGTLGVLFMGLTFVIAAFTCTAPFIGTVLVAAASAKTGAQWVLPILGMTTFATALALPFFLLSLFPSLLAKMPRSGAWLSTVKGAMGFLELAAALKFLSNADLVWQWGIITQPMLLALWALIAALAAFWLAGLLKIGISAPEGRLTPVRGAWTAAFAAAAVYCVWGLTGRPLNPLVASLLPPPDYGYGAVARQGHDELPWLPTLEEGLAKAKAENRPVFIDFTGHTCTNCRWVEQNVFVRAEVQEELKKFVLVRLYTDDKDESLATKRQAYQEKTFGTVALPLYAVVSPDGKPLQSGDVAAFGGTTSPASFADRFVEFLGKPATAETAVVRN